MAGYKVDQFRGIRPRISSRKLPEGEAFVATNIRLGSGDLKTWNGPTSDYALDDDDRVTIFRYDNDDTPIWFEWDTDVDVARGVLRDDALERVYYTGDGFPKMTYRSIANTAAPYPDDWRRLGLPEPAAAAEVDAPTIVDTIVGTTGTISGGMTSNHFYLGIVNTVWEETNGTTPPEDERVYILPNLGSDAPIDIGIEVGDTFVVSVVDADNITLSNPNSEYLSKSSRTTSPRDGSTSETALSMVDEGGGAANLAGFIYAPNGIEVSLPSHGLFEGSEIVVKSVTLPPKWRYETGDTATPSAGIAGGPFPYFLVDYPDTGPYPSAPDNTETTIHECTFNDAGDHFDIYGSFTYEVISEGVGSTAAVEERAYVYTYVTALGEEGPPSAASSFVEVVDGSTVTIDTFSAPPGSGAGYDITNIRIYRTNSTTEDAAFQFVAEITVAAGTYDDSVTNENLGEILPSANWDRPDADMQGITTLANGMMMGFKDKTLYFCEPYFPHAWPAIYDQAVDYDIVGIAAVGTSAVVITDGTPYIVTGAHPRNVSVRPYKINQAGVSKRSIAHDNDNVVYASPDGLVKLGIDGARIITDPYYAREDWQAISPSTIVAEIHDGKYFGFRSGGSFVFDFNNPAVGLSDTQIFQDQTLESASWDEGAGWAFAGGEASLSDGMFVSLNLFDASDYSPDGITWATSNSPAASIHEIAYSTAAGKFFMFRGLGNTEGRYRTSEDGINWSPSELLLTADADISTARSVEWYPELELFVWGSEGSNSSVVFTSPDGINWTSRATSEPSVGETLSYQAYDPVGNVLILATSGKIIRRSDDSAVTFSRITVSISGNITGIVWAADIGLFIIVDDDGEFITSPDGVTWSTPGVIGSNVAAFAGGIAYNEETGRTLVHDFSGTPRAAYTDDGVSWTTTAGNAFGQHLLSYGGGLFVASVAANYATKTSPDGVNWTSRTRPDLGQLSEMYYAPQITGFRDIVHSDKVPTLEGQEFTVRVIASNVEGEVRLGVEWRDSGDSVLSTTYSTETLSAAGTLIFTAIAPTDTATASLVVSAYGPTTITSAGYIADIVDTFLDIETDTLYYTEGENVFSWDTDEDSPMTMTWRSGELRMQKPINVGAGVVEAETYPVTFKLYGDGVLRATRTVSDDAPFRLPGGYLASTYQTEINGTSRVYEARIAETIYELAEG